VGIDRCRPAVLRRPPCRGEALVSRPFPFNGME
jgi:hypothetical protein